MKSLIVLAVGLAILMPLQSQAQQSSATAILEADKPASLYITNTPPVSVPGASNNKIYWFNTTDNDETIVFDWKYSLTMPGQPVQTRSGKTDPITFMPFEKNGKVVIEGHLGIVGSYGYGQYTATATISASVSGTGVPGNPALGTSDTRNFLVLPSFFIFPSRWFTVLPIGFDPAP